MLSNTKSVDHREKQGERGDRLISDHIFQRAVFQPHSAARRRNVLVRAAKEGARTSLLFSHSRLLPHRESGANNHHPRSKMITDGGGDSANEERQGAANRDDSVT